MSALQVFDRELAQRDCDSPDTWYDDGILFVGQIAAELTDEDLVALGHLWPQRTARWQLHCAEVLGLARRTGSIRLLLGLVDRAQPDVSLAALESLREFDPSLFSEAQHRRIFSAVDAAKARPVGRLHQLVLAEFQKKLRDKPPGDT